MKHLKVNLEHCYGINMLVHDFDFTKSHTCAVYASNGLMKSSFAKTFRDVGNGLKPQDVMFPSHATVCQISSDNNDISRDQLFVIESYNSGFKSDRMSTLLVNKNLKERYDKVHQGIDDKKVELLEELIKLSGLRKGVEQEISEIFTGSDNQFLRVMTDIENRVLDDTDAELSDISYREISNDKVIAFLATKDFKQKLEEYVNKYDELIDASRYFKKGVFSHNNAAIIAKNLADNGFFEAMHSVSLNTEDNAREVKTSRELELVIKEEKKAILNDPGLLKRFEEIDKALQANEDLRRFRDYLLEHMKIIPALKDIVSFQQTLWIDYIKECREMYRNLLDEYKKGKSELATIAKQAKEENTLWRDVVDEFNRRFIVPFKLEIQNQEDVILKQEVPSVAFLFEYAGEVTETDEGTLSRVLSSGEQKALYLLNIIFEVEARKKENVETLFVIDDIADSFDYKNKYAIVEYLKEISEEEKFYQIILTHNFDFFRTVESRGIVDYNNCFFVERTDTEIKVSKASYIRNPFTSWMQGLSDDKKLVASISFVRNLIEYTQGRNSDYEKLASLLHIKPDSSSICKRDLQGIYKRVFPNLPLDLENKDKGMLELIYELADQCLISSEGINLEDKVVLAIAIRLSADRFMIDKLNDGSVSSENQTGVLLQKFKDKFNNQDSESAHLKLLKRVNLMTPENIHLNAFMYEPILDMSCEQLKNLYGEVKQLQKQPITA